VASIDAVEKLKAGGTDWTDYLAAHFGRVDLRFADLRDLDLRNRAFARCDLAGAILNDANLDGSWFNDCDFSGASLVYASVVGCVLDGVLGIRPNLSHATIRASFVTGLTLQIEQAIGLVIQDTTISNSRIEASNLSGARFSRAILDNLHLEDVHGEDFSMSDSTIRAGRFESLALEKSTWSGVTASDCQFLDLVFANGSFQNNGIREAQLINVSLPGTVTELLDLTHSIVRNSELSGFGLNTAILLDAAFVNCAWPPQAGRVTIDGRYQPSMELIRQPVQDVQGLSPVLRREIADAQYLVERLERASASTTARALMRTWGTVSSFGQSIVRLGVWSLAVIAMLSLFLLGTRHQLIGSHFYPSELGNAVLAVAKAFLGISSSTSPNTGGQLAVIACARAAGFLALGFWISIASRGLSRLSSE
jgi:uncharacterized protein YjbI with pentapeptide repeats